MRLESADAGGTEPVEVIRSADFQFTEAGWRPKGTRLNVWRFVEHYGREQETGAVISKELQSALGQVAQSNYMEASFQLRTISRDTAGHYGNWMTVMHLKCKL